MAILTFLSVLEVVGVHADQINKYGGSHGIRDMGLLESAVFRPQTSFGGQYLYKSIFDKAAALGQSIILNHPFIDGNKRTGIVSMIVLLKANGYKLKVSQSDLIRMALKIAKEETEFEDIAAWLKKNSKKA